MKHAYLQICQLVREALQGLPTSGPRVFVERRGTLAPAQVPALLIERGNESVSPFPARRAVGPRIMVRNLDLMVRCVAVGDNYADALAAMAAEVESRIGADPTLGGHVADTVITGSDPDGSEDGDQIVGELRLAYRITYHTREDTPGVLITGD